MSLLLASAAPPPTAPEIGRTPVSARDLVEVAEIGAPTLSPDGRRVAYRVSRPSVDHNKIRLDWYVATLGGLTELHVGSGGDAMFDGSGGVADQVPVWDGDSRGLRFRARVDGIVAIWHWREGEALRREIVDAADIVDFAVSADGGTLRYTVGASRAEIAAAEDRAYREGVLVDHRLDIMQPVAGGAVEDGKRVMQQLPTEWFERERLLWDAPRTQKFVAIGESPKVSTPVFADASPAQAKRVASARGAVAEITGSGDKRLVRLTSPDGTPPTCAAPVCRSPALTALAWQPGSGALLLFEREGSARETVYRWRVGAPTARLVATIDGAQRTSYRAPRCAVGRSSLICAESAPADPPRLVEIDISTGARHVLADPNAALRGRILARAETMEWGADVTGILLLPPRSRGPLPLVVQYYHCAGFLKGGVGDEIPMLPLVEKGIAVLCMDRTRSPNAEAADAGYRLALADIERALDDLAAKGIIDPARVGIGGLSFGSEVALWAIRHSKRFAAATSASGQISPIYYWANALPGRGFPEMLKRYWGLGDPDSDTARWKALSPTADAAEIDTPLLMQLPESEARYVVEFHTKLKRAGKPAVMFVFADEPHIKNQPAHKLAVYARNLDWYRFWLKDEEDADPAKRVQYTRWRQLRAGAPQEPLPAPAP
ncbi:Atxe2 family lasso peptide isopeptidase [Sphingopyxis sp.]|uniref:Atxe2 family lasso peptide isopeptidase n=1 Tax=Sphingopyxis sp. TaxID=1908224 RepID=UPI002FC9B1D9